MPKGYWLPHLDVSNPQGFQAYRDTADAWHRTNGSVLLARGGASEIVEGKMRARNVIREYPSYEIAIAAYHGPDYTRAHALREGHAACDFPIVEGYDGPQPDRLGRLPRRARARAIGSRMSISPTWMATSATKWPTRSRSACTARAF